MNETTTEHQFTDAEIAMLRYTDDDFTYAKTEASKHATDIAKEFDQIDGKKRTILEPIVVNLPRQSKDYIKWDSTPEIYIYNFEPSGFVILGADERSLGELFKSSSATWDRNIHAGYKIVTEGAIAKVVSEREQFYKERDSLFGTQTFRDLQKKIQHYWESKALARPLLSKWIDGIQRLFSTPAYAQSTLSDVQRSYGSAFTIQYTGRTVPVTYQEGATQVLKKKTDLVLLRTDFHQGYPYNSKMDKMGCSEDPAGRALAGCVPVAYAQILLYYNTAKSRQNIPYLDVLRNHHYDINNPKRMGASVYSDYPLISVGSAPVNIGDVAGDLIKRIYLFIPYGSKSQGCDKTGIGSVAGDYSPVFNKSWGFQPVTLEDYNASEVWGSIQQKKPVWIRGDAVKNGGWLCDNLGDWFCSYGEGHAWVVDGIDIEEVSYTAVTEMRDVYVLTPNWSPSSRWNLTWPIGGTKSVAKVTEFRQVSNQIHNNWGWGDNRYSYSDYTGSEWGDNGVFTPTQKPGRQYAYKLRIFPFVTPL